MASQTIVIYRLTYKGVHGPGQDRSRPTLPTKFDSGAAVRVHKKLAKLTAVQHCLVDVKRDDVTMVLATESHRLAGEGVTLTDDQLTVSFYDQKLVTDLRKLQEQSDAEYITAWQPFYDPHERLPSRKDKIARAESDLQVTRSDYVFTVDTLSVTGRESPTVPAAGPTAPASTNDPSLALLKELASLLGQIAKLSYSSPQPF